MSENKELTPVDKSPGAMIALAVKSGADLDKIEKLMQLQERYEANEAKKAYVVAMAAFKADPPKIDKDKTVSYGTTKYNHASLANVTEKINAALAKYGLSAGWATKQDGTGISVTCTITHQLGHSEATTLTAEADNSGQKNKIQGIGSTITYLERYTILALTGLATHDQDDDGDKSETITEVQCNKLHAMLNENELSEKFKAALLAGLKVESLADVLSKDYGKAETTIDAAIKRKKAATK